MEGHVGPPEVSLSVQDGVGENVVLYEKRSF